MVCPAPRTSSAASSSRCASTTSANRRSNRPRSAGARAAQPTCAAAARSMAASVSSTPHCGTVRTTSSVAGSRTSYLAPSVDIVLTRASQPLEPSEPLPVRHRRLEGGQLDVGRVHVVVDDVVPEGLTGEGGALEQVPCRAQRRRHARLVRGVRVALERRLELHPLLDSPQSAG